jgi:hypothetical protein
VLLGFFGLVGAIVYKLGKPPEPTVAGAPAPASAPVPGRAAWGRAGLDQPAGTRIQSVTASGALIVLQLYTDAPGNDERLVVVDPASGQVVGTFVPGAK